jgi:hypothetical protein
MVEAVAALTKETAEGTALDPEMFANAVPVAIVGSCAKVTWPES